MIGASALNFELENCIMSEQIYSDMMQLSGSKIQSKAPIFHAPDFCKESVNFA